MDIKKYIESGILDEFVFGTLSQEEMVEVQELSMQYPEILQAINSIDATVVPKIAMPAPAGLLDKIMADLPPTDSPEASNDAPEPKADAGKEAVLPPSGYPTWMLLLLSFLLIGSLLLNMWYWNENELKTAKINQQTRIVTDLQTKNKLINDSLGLYKIMAGHCEKGNATIPLLIAANDPEMNDLLIRGYIPYHVNYNYDTKFPKDQYFFRHPSNYDVLSIGEPMTFPGKELYAWRVTLVDGKPTKVDKLGALQPNSSFNTSLVNVSPASSQEETVVFGISLEPIGSDPTAPSEGVRTTTDSI